MLTINILLAGKNPVKGPASDHARFQRVLREPTGLKDVLQAVGIPHCEVGSVRLVAPEAAPGPELPLDLVVRENLTVEVRPAGVRALVDPRFVCDFHLGKLAFLLRILGLDTLWMREPGEAAIARFAVNEGRTVLSRSRSLLKRSVMNNAMLIMPDDPDQQARDVIVRFDLAPKVRLFGRCGRCNGSLNAVDKDVVADRIPPRTARWLDSYVVCADCDRLYWEGTHAQALRRRLGRILEAAAT